MEDTETDTKKLNEAVHQVDEINIKELYETMQQVYKTDTKDLDKIVQVDETDIKKLDEMVHQVASDHVLQEACKLLFFYYIYYF